MGLVLPLKELVAVPKSRSLIEQIHLLRKTLHGAPREKKFAVDPQEKSDLCGSVSPEPCLEAEAAEFAGDALATLEDWETELTLKDLRPDRSSRWTSCVVPGSAS